MASPSSIFRTNEHQHQYHEHHHQQHQRQCGDDDQSDDAPLLRLRMKKSFNHDQEPMIAQTSTTEMIDHLHLMARQSETTYKCSNDYIHHQQEQLYKYKHQQEQRQKQHYYNNNNYEQQHQHQRHDSSSYYELLDDNFQEEIMIDTICREKMCEWSYKIVDHYHLPRQIVSVSMSYLDRFVASYYNDNNNEQHHKDDEGEPIIIDKTTFKLAAITSLYMSSKLFFSNHNIKRNNNNNDDDDDDDDDADNNNKHSYPMPITMAKLSDLSHGEFTIDDICHMEHIILFQLNWFVHPPTVQDFVNNLIQVYLKPILLSSSGQQQHLYESTLQKIQDRSMFLAELVSFDYSSILQESSFKIAISCIINAMEGINAANYNYSDYDPQEYEPQEETAEEMTSSSYCFSKQTYKKKKKKNRQAHNLCSISNQKKFIQLVESEFITELQQQQQQEEEDLMIDQERQGPQNPFSLIVSIDFIRDRLWYLYKISIQYHDECYSRTQPSHQQHHQPSTPLQEHQQQHIISTTRTLHQATPTMNTSTTYDKSDSVNRAQEEEERDDTIEHNDTSSNSNITTANNGNHIVNRGNKNIIKNYRRGEQQHHQRSISNKSSPVGVIITPTIDCYNNAD